MLYHVLMVAGAVGAFLIPIAFGFSEGAMIAAHVCILVVTIAIFLGTLNLNKIGRR